MDYDVAVRILERLDSIDSRLASIEEDGEEDTQEVFLPHRQDPDKKVHRHLKIVPASGE